MSDDYGLTLAVFDSGEARDKLRDATRIVLELEDAFKRAVDDAAEAEAFYRVRLAEAFRAHRESGAAVEAANTLARGECAAHSQERDRTAGMLKLAGEKLENARDTRRSLWRLVEWARDRELATIKPGQQTAMNSAAPAWPSS
jgi:hypothetical protein